MAHLSLEAKESIIKQTINRGHKSVKEIAETNNIGCSTLHRWVKEYRPSNSTLGKTCKVKISRETKLNHIIATTSLDESSLGIYCREQGIYSHQLLQWKQDLMSDSPQKNSELKSELKKLKLENKLLKKDLNRKDKALAETSALLVLKKKADLIWGVDEEN